MLIAFTLDTVRIGAAVENPLVSVDAHRLGVCLRAARKFPELFACQGFVAGCHCQLNYARYTSLINHDGCELS